MAGSVSFDGLISALKGVTEVADSVIGSYNELEETTVGLLNTSNKLTKALLNMSKTKIYGGSSEKQLISFYNILDQISSKINNISSLDDEFSIKIDDSETKAFLENFGINIVDGDVLVNLKSVEELFDAISSEIFEAGNRATIFATVFDYFKKNNIDESKYTKIFELIKEGSIDSANSVKAYLDIASKLESSEDIGKYIPSSAISQKGKVGDKNGWAWVEDLGGGQVQSHIVKLNKDTGKLEETTSAISSNFKQVEQEVSVLDSEINNLNNQRLDNLSKYGEDYDVSAIKESIDLLETRRDLLLDTLESYSEKDEYKYSSHDYNKFEQKRSEDQILRDNRRIQQEQNRAQEEELKEGKKIAKAQAEEYAKRELEYTRTRAKYIKEGQKQAEEAEYSGAADAIYDANKLTQEEKTAEKARKEAFKAREQEAKEQADREKFWNEALGKRQHEENRRRIEEQRKANIEQEEENKRFIAKQAADYANEEKLYNDEIKKAKEKNRKDQKKYDKQVAAKREKDIKEQQQSENLVAKSETRSGSLTAYESQLEKEGKLTEELKEKIAALKTELNSASNSTLLSTWDEHFKQLKQQAAGIEVKPEIDSVSEAFKKLISTEEQHRKLRRKQDDGKASVEELVALQQITEERNKAYDIILETRELTQEQIELDRQHKNLINQIEAAEAEVNNEANKNKNQKESAKELERSVKLYNSLLEKARGDASNSKYTDSFQNSLTEVINSIEHTDVEKIEEVSNAITILQSALSEGKDKKNISSTYTKLKSLQNQIADDLSKNTSMTPKLRREFEGLNDTIEKMISSGKFTNRQLQEAQSNLIDLETTMVRTGQDGASWIDKVRNRLTDMNSKLVAQYLSWQDWIRYIRTAVNTITELDTALIDLRKTTTMNNEELNSFYLNSSKIAKETGVTTAEIISQASAWSRLGYSSNEAATEMAELSSKFAQISPGMSVDVATDGLVSTMKAFDIEVENVQRKIMDNVNIIGNTMATSNEEIVDMLTRSSAAMDAANNTLEETIALESAAVEITRNAETTGTAFKTLSMRIRGYDEETEELSEDLVDISGKIADLTKTAKTPGGISLFTDDGKTYKSTYQILKDISEIWDQLTDKNQAALLEKLAGKRGGQVVAGLLNNFDAVDNALATMENAAGSADKEMEIIQDSIEYKLNALKQTWVGLLQELVDRGDLGKLIDGLTELSEAIAGIVESVGLLPPIGVVGAILGIKQLPKLFDTLGILFSAKTISPSIIGELKILSATGELTVDSLKDLSSGAAEIAGSFIGAEDPLKSLNKTIDQSDAKAKILKNLWTGLAVGAAALAAVSIYKLATAQKEINKQAEEAAKKYSDSKNKLNAYKDEVLELQKTANDHNKSLEEQSNARKRLLDIQAEMAESYGAEANKIKILTDNVDELSNAFNRLSNKDYQEFKNALNDNSGWQGFWNNISNWSNGYKDNLDSIKDQMENKTFGFNVSTNELAKKIQEEFASKGLSVNINKQDNGQFNISGVGNLEDYYNGLITIQTKYKNNTQLMSEDVSNMLGDLANDAKKDLGEISDSYNTYLENEVIFPKYGDQVAQLQRSMNAVKEAKIAGDEAAIQSASQSFAQLYSRIYSSIDEEESRNWFESLVAGYQDIIDEQNFTAKIKPVLGASGNNEFNEIEELLSNTDISKEMLSSLATGDMSSRDIANTYGDKISRIIGYIRRTAENEGISIPFIIDKFEADGAVLDDAKKQFIERFPHLSQELSEEDLKIALTIPNAVYLSWNKLLGKIQAVKDSENEAEKNRRAAISSINEMTDGFNVMDEIYADVKNGDVFDFTKLDTKKFEESFKNLKPEYEAFIDTISNNPNNIKATQEAFDNLATAFIRTNGIYDNLSNKNKEVAEGMLTNRGITNAHILVLQELDRRNVELTDSEKEELQAAQELAQAEYELNEQEAKEYITKNNIKDITLERVDSLFDEATASGVSKAALADLILSENLLQNTNLDLSQQVQAILDVGAAAGLSQSKLSALQADFDPYKHGGGFDAMAQLKANTRQAIYDEFAKYQRASYGGGDKSNKTSGGSSSSTDKYVKEFENALKKIENLKKGGVISEREYLQQMKDLYVKYFGGMDQYYDKFAEYQGKYLEGMRDLYKNAISGAKTVINYQINSLSKEKDKLVKQYQKDQKNATKPLEKQIKALNKQKDALEKQKEAMQKANDERERALNLQEKQYNLERLQAQRTRLVFKNGEMVYQTDNSEIRNAREDLRQTLVDAEIAKLDDQIEKIDDQIENLQNRLDDINDYYSELIEQTEEFYDAQIEALQNMLDKWEEFEAKMDLAKALNYLHQFGFTMEDVLNGNEKALAVLGQGWIDCELALGEGAEGISKAFGTMSKDSQAAINEICGYTPSEIAWAEKMKNQVGEATEEVEKLKGALTGNSGSSNAANGSSTSGTKGVDSSLKDVGTAASNINFTQTGAKEFADELVRISDALNGGEAGTPIADALTTISGLSFETPTESMKGLAEAVDETASALGGEGSTQYDSHGVQMNAGYTGEYSSGGSEGLVSNLQEVNNSNLDNITSQFNDNLTPAITNSNKAINGQGGGQGESNGEGGEASQDTLVGAIEFLQEGEVTTPITTVTNLFFEMYHQIESCVASIDQMIRKIEQLGTIKMPVLNYRGTAYSNGSAYASGKWSAQSKGTTGKSLVGELGPEIRVRDGKYEVLGANGAEMTDVRPNDIIFNAAQSRALLEYGHINSRGKAYADGTFSPLSDIESSRYNLLGKVDNLVERLEFGNQRLITIDKNVDKISTSTTNNYSSTPVINVTNPTFTCTGVTGEEVLHQIESSFTGLFVNAYQKSMTK